MKIDTGESNLPLPPGPRGLPVLGSLHLLTKDAHQAINQIARRYGDVCLIWVGRIPTVVISDPAILAEAFQRPEFADRWVSRAFEILTDRQSIAMSPYGERWHSISNLMHENLSCPHGAAVIHDRQAVPAVQRLIDRLARSADLGNPVNITEIIDDASWDITFSIMFGSDSSDPPEYSTLKMVMRQDTEWAERAAARLSAGDLLPWLKFLPDPYLNQAKRQQTDQKSDPAEAVRYRSQPSLIYQRGSHLHHGLYAEATGRAIRSINFSFVHRYALGHQSGHTPHA